MSRIKEYREMTEDQLYDALDKGNPRDQYELANQELQNTKRRRFGTNSVRVLIAGPNFLSSYDAA
jgi:hypothetical protein